MILLFFIFKCLSSHRSAASSGNSVIRQRRGREEEEKEKEVEVEVEKEVERMWSKSCQIKCKNNVGKLMGVTVRSCDRVRVRVKGRLRR